MAEVFIHLNQFKNPHKILCESAADLWNFQCYIKAFEFESGWYYKYLFPIDFKF